MHLQCQYKLQRLLKELKNGSHHTAFRFLDQVSVSLSSLPVCSSKADSNSIAWLGNTHQMDGFCTVLTWQVNFPCSVAWKDAVCLGGLSFRFCLTNYSATPLLLLLLNFSSMPLWVGSFWGGTKHYISIKCSQTLRLWIYYSCCFSSLPQSPLLDFRLLKRIKSD